MSPGERTLLLTVGNDPLAGSRIGFKRSGHYSYLHLVESLGAIKGKVSFMQQPRRRRWIFFLALTLGVLVWWGLGWYLSPRPLYTLRFPEKVDSVHDPAVPPDIRFRPLDRDGNYFCVIEPIKIDQFNERIFLYVIDSRTGATLRTHRFFQKGSLVGFDQEKENDHVDYSIGSDILRWQLWSSNLNHLSEPSASHHFMVYHHDELVQRHAELWQWNLLTNERKFIRSLTVESDIEFSSDGKMLIEYFTIPPYLVVPQVYSGWIDQITSLLGARYAWQDLGSVYVRAWSLPDMHLLSQMLLPFPAGLSQIQLTTDGKWLVLGSRGKNTPNYWANVSPQKINTYDLKNGQLYRTVDISDCEIGAITTEAPDIFLVRTDVEVPNEEAKNAKDKNLPIALTSFHMTWRMLHLPSGQWLNVSFDNSDWTGIYVTSLAQSKAGIQKKIRLVASHSKKPLSAVYEVDTEGTLSEVAQIPHDYKNIPTLVPQSNQIIFCSSRVKLPEWLDQWARKVEWLAKWLDEECYDTVVWDFARQKEICSLPLDSKSVGTAILPSDQRIFFYYLDNVSFKMAVFQLPFPDYSPWWSRFAGVVTLVLVWFLLRQRFARSRPAVG